MRIIQSFWSKPSFHEKQNYQNARKFGGWSNYKYFLLSNVFSCLTLKRHNNEIKLYTDDNGFSLFINLLGLPYDSVSLSLNDLEHENHKLWILGKVKAIKDQDKPFIHVDNDVYMWGGFPKNFEKDYLIAQSALPLPQVYRNSLSDVQKIFSWLPDCLKETPHENTSLANVGIVGGNDIDFFQEFCEISSLLLEKNRHHLSFVDNIGGFNQIMEEYLFTSFARKKGSRVHYLIDSSKDKVPMESVLRFNLVPIFEKYIHLIGIAKQNYYACEQLELRVKYEFPSYHKKVLKAIERIDNIDFNDNNSFCNQRQNKLLRCLDKLYTIDFNLIKELKIRLSDDVTIFSEGQGSTACHSIKTLDPASGSETVRNLIGSDNLLLYFNSPLTINEILDNIKNSRNDLSVEELDIIKFNLIDSVMEKIVVTGDLEFV